MQPDASRWAIVIATIAALLPTVRANANSTVEAVLAGKKCSEHRQQLNCTYRVGRSLHFEIAGIGMPDTAVTFYQVNWDGDFYASMGVLHGCVIVKPGKKATDESLFSLAFVSPLNGKVYRSWEDCRARA